MAHIQRLYDFQAGTKIISSQVDAEFNQLISYVNGLDDANGVLAGATGATKVGFEATEGVNETNVQDAIENVQAQIASVVLGAIPNGSITNDKMDASMKKGVAGGVAAYNDYILTQGLSRRNLINILRLKLQQALASSDIDAWSDLMADSDMIDTANSQCGIHDGIMDTRSFAAIATTTNDGDFGNTTYLKQGQTFTPAHNCAVGSVSVKLKKVGSPTDNVVMKIYSTASGLPDALLYTSSTTIAGSSLTVSLAYYSFDFSDADLTAGTQYAIVLERSGSQDNTKYYIANRQSDSIYDGGTNVVYTSSWATRSYDLDFKVFTESAFAVWKPVTATEAFAMMALSADQDEGTGTITWYVSDDGNNWIEMPLDTMTEVNFASTSVYLKCVLTGDATVSSVAYGGY